MCNGVFSQSLKVYVRDSAPENYVLDACKRYNDTTFAYSYIGKYISKLTSKSFVEAGCDSIVIDSMEMSAYVTRGKSYENVNVDCSELPDRFKVRSDRPIDYYINLCDRVVDYYSNSGYLFAKAGLDSVSFDQGTFSAKIIVDRGCRIEIDSLIVMGDAKITNNYLERSLELRKGKVLDFSKISKIDARLNNMPFLEQEKAYQLAFSDCKSDVMLFLKKKKASAFSGVLGLMPQSQTTRKLMVTGDIDLSLVNVFHRGENFNFAWKKYETQNQTLNVGGSFPYVFKSPLGLGADFNLEKKDSSYLKTDFVGKIIIGNSSDVMYSLYYKYVSSFPISKVTNDTSGNFASLSTNMAGVSLFFRNVDNARNPYRGVVLSLSADAGQKKGKSDEFGGNMFAATVQYSVDGYIGLCPKLTLRLRNDSYYAYGSSMYDNELLYVGGLRTIRGFDELSLPATFYTLASAEVRFLFEENSAVYLLSDYMFLGKKNTLSDCANHALGVGVGLDLNTPAGVFSLVYAVGKWNDNPFSIRNSKIHFGYKSYF